MQKQHHYNTVIKWTGNRGAGTAGYRSYDRSHILSISTKADIACSSDPAFLGDSTKHNPEELLLASLSSCHMLWYLHLCSDAGVIVTAYTDQAKGIMEETADGGGRFISVTLFPQVAVSDASMINLANELHRKAHAMCFIANSVNFPVLHEPTCTVG